MKTDDVYSFNIELNNHEILSLSSLKGKVILVVNTALHSPFTSFYPFLESLYLRYHDEGFEIIDVPCNQFQNQTPESDDEINEYCKREFKTTFLRVVKQDVAGEGKSELYSYLIKKRKFKGFDPNHLLTPVLNCREIKKGPDWMSNPEVRENFTFFFIDKKGKVARRLEATTSKEKIESTLVSLLDKLD